MILQVLSRSDFPGHLPPMSKYVGRGTPAGNEFRIGVDGTRDQVIDRYIAHRRDDAQFIAWVKANLKGFHLVCHCAPKRCHAGWLMAVANDLPYEPQRNRYLAVEC
ncbi:hypothetical protein D869_gp217 [Caulobacter phage CcrRogue]|uniref:DUF4326 domain-containing protein n=1 Tax=Caulobacter phage CcrRogue TaxID=2927986 RepID=K4K388_9CAUD|nr:hypothetical protein D869_gp217 [Caulobacter phage CcrRogue]AFU86697.1 hypothetical protein CcrRogue_gp215 [Caulobacter phage CcrRogue]